MGTGSGWSYTAPGFSPMGIPDWSQPSWMQPSSTAPDGGGFSVAQTSAPSFSSGGSGPQIWDSGGTGFAPHMTPSELLANPTLAPSGDELYRTVGGTSHSDIMSKMQADYQASKAVLDRYARQMAADTSAFAGHQLGVQQAQQQQFNANQWGNNPTTLFGQFQSFQSPQWQPPPISYSFL
jgi:hypothetical protein